jgi:zinc transporter ZupT
LHRLLSEDEKHPATAIILTTISGLASTLGGLLVVCMGAPSEGVMGHMLSFAAGIMLYISYADLLPHAIGDMASPTDLAVGGAGGHQHGHSHSHGHSHGHEDLGGFRDANLWLFVGMAVFLAVTALLPEFSLGPEDEEADGKASAGHGHSHGAARRVPQLLTAESAERSEAEPGDAGADAATGEQGEGAADEYAGRTAVQLKEECSRLGLSSQGKKSELLARLRLHNAEQPAPVSRGGRPRRASHGGRADHSSRPEEAPGSSSSAVVSTPAPSAAAAAPKPVPVKPKRTARQRSLLMTGLVATVGISLHNLPEGLIVYNQTITGICREGWYNDAGAAGPATVADYMPWNWGGRVDLSKCLTRGVAVTFALASHNIPEGAAVAAPIYVSTGSAWQAMKFCFLSAICEPIAAILFGWFFSSYLTHYVVAALNAAVSGIMICLCLVELIPTAAAHVGAKVRPSLRLRASEAGYHRRAWLPLLVCIFDRGIIPLPQLCSLYSPPPIPHPIPPPALPCSPLPSPTWRASWSCSDPCLPCGTRGCTERLLTAAVAARCCNVNWNGGSPLAFGQRRFKAAFTAAHAS